jgi:hypothetical protein
MAAEMSYLSCSKPKEPAMPQHPGAGDLEVDAEAAQEGFFGGHLHDGFVMAVAVEERFAVQLGQRENVGVWASSRGIR